MRHHRLPRRGVTRMTHTHFEVRSVPSLTIPQRLETSRKVRVFETRAYLTGTPKLAWSSWPTRLADGGGQYVRALARMPKVMVDPRTCHK